MKVGEKAYRTIWMSGEKTVCVIDQRELPHRFMIDELRTYKEVITAIKDMQVRGAGLIGAAAGYGMYLAANEALKAADFENFISRAAIELKSSRPTAVNLAWAVDRQLREMSACVTPAEKMQAALRTAEQIANEDADFCRSIGLHGATVIESLSRRRNGKTVNILTHCNAGWLAFVDHGSALSPVYEAHDRGISVHVWVDETRPRNQGASLTAWELLNHGVPHTVIADNTGGHLMQQGMVDIVITGADRVTSGGDAANKIGTYLKALAARDNNIPFYIAFPSSTFDWTIKDGAREIEIEERSADEVKYIRGLCPDGQLRTVLVTPKESKAVNYGFDVTPARLITGLITERGICKANAEAIQELFAGAPTQ
jgi:methylthioribose-1-phosphate isomerase